MADDEQAITDYAAGLFLRYFRSGVHAQPGAPAIDARRDLELLRGHWALSGPVRSFLQYVLTHPHEAQSLLMFRQRYDDAVARGRIDARATAMLRLTSGLSSAVVAAEPVRSFDTGPNQVVAWVVHHAALHAERLFDQQPEGSGYRSLLETTMADLAAVKRLDALREPLKSASTRRRPAPGAIRDAARSRRPPYRHAVAAFQVLSDIESGETAAILAVVQSTLIAPLEIWRRLELAVAVGIGLALSAETGTPMRMNILAGRSDAPIITCGRYAIYWQQLTSHYKQPAREPSEQRVHDVLAAYDLKQAGDRPDLVVVDEEKACVQAIVEVKYLAGDTATVRFREAAAQVIRYARGYASTADIDDLVRRSLIAMNSGAPAMIDPLAAAPSAVDFMSMQKGALLSWVRSRLLAPS